jgi:hypothetical protein
MVEEHKRLEVGANEGRQKTGLQDNRSSQDPAAPQAGDSSSLLPDKTMDAERPMETSDREQPGTGERPREPAAPTSSEGSQREGMHESGVRTSDTASENTGVAPSSPESSVIDKAVPTTLAYTASQQSNLPGSESSDIDYPSDLQGSGKLEESVERRANTLVFNEATGKFTVKDEEHGTGMTSQDKT